MKIAASILATALCIALPLGAVASDHSGGGGGGGEAIVVEVAAVAAVAVEVVARIPRPRREQRPFRVRDRPRICNLSRIRNQ